MILATVASFFGLQFLAHHITRLHSFFSFVYPLLAMLVFVFALVGCLITACMWFSARDTTTKMTRRNWFATFATMLILGVTASIGSAAYGRGLPPGSFVSKFDQRIWASESSLKHVSGDITDRQKMLGDVVQQLVANGTKAKIIAMLGPSDDSGYFKSSGRDLIYCTGPQRDSPFPIDNEWLLIWFDQSGRTSRYEIWSD
jgi:hypothetical protein